MTRSLAIVALIFAACSTASASGVDGVRFTVCPSGCDYTSIQDAIDDAFAPSTIVVKAGTYNENEINTSGLPYTITGEVASDGTLLTTISGANLDVDENSSVFYFNSGETSTTVIQNLIIADGNAHGYGGGIQVFNCSPTIKSCTITGNSALYRNDGSAENNPSGGGIYLSGSDSLIEDCTITSNRAQWEGSKDAAGGSGVICSDSSPSFVNCLIADNFGYNAGGAYCEYDSEARFYKCVFSGNVGGFYSAAPGALASVSGSNVSLKDCLLCDNAGADPQAPTNILGQWTDLGGNELLTDCPIPPCIADINRDGVVNGVDFAYILERWGSDDPLADLNGDGQVDSADLGLAIADWGSCA
ncbi:MAG: hypothetical protein CMJ27_13370 [Phycisphaerae bacterium]|nr:hypothetical protein [Phycisphaerae bacterium]OUW99981.1 MAG: hypothetical protein CBD91_07635 [Phycisphaeraceae bacterium TMED231]